MSIDKFWLAVDEVINAYKAAASDGITFEEAWALSLRGLNTLIVLAEALSGLAGEEKKKVVLDAFARFYDGVVAPYDIPRIPNVVEVFVDGAIKQIFLMLAASSIDAIVAVLQRNGWNNVPSDVTPVGNPTEPADAPGSDFSPY